MIYLGFVLIGIWALLATVLLIIAVQRSGRNEVAIAALQKKPREVTDWVFLSDEKDLKL